ncbi:MAG: hypothetical protein WC708_14390 [Lentisphaeria bacterium]
MLSETFELYKALEKAGVKIPHRHRDLQDVSGDGFVLRIDNARRIVAVSYYDAKQRPLWKIAPDNQNSFPSLKLHAPLLKPPSGGSIPTTLFDIKKHPIEVAKFLSEAVATWDLTYDKKMLQKFWSRYQEMPSKIIGEFGAILPQDEGLGTLLKTLATAGDFTEEKAKTVLRHIAQTLAAAVLSGRIDAVARVAALLVGSPDKKNKTFKEEGNIAIWLDGYPDSIIDYRRMVLKVSNWLYERDEQRDGKQAPKTGICSLSGGVPQPLVSGTFPQVNLPVFQQKTALMAMNKDIPCHYRYSAIAADIFPVGRSLANNLANSLDWITDGSRKYQTWSPVPSGKWAGKQRQYDLLIVYLEEKPDFDARFAGCIVGPETDEAEQAEASFMAATKTVIQTLRTQRPADWQNEWLRCFMLREIDPGRRQVVYTERFTTGDFFRASENWQLAAQNVPPFELLIPTEKGEPAKRVKTEAPFLPRIVELLQQQWIREGLENNKVHGVSLGDVVTLFLGRSTHVELAERMLNMELARTISLWVAVGQARHSDDAVTLKTEVKRTVLDSISFLGILLFKLNIRKETYMSGNPYNLGRLLAATDILYREYSKIERKESKPSRLLGSSFVQLIADNPSRGLAQLAERLPLYTEWARKMPGGAPYGLAHWSVNLLGRISSEVNHDELASKKMEDKEKAQLLLGYLSNFHKDEEQIKE